MAEALVFFLVEQLGSIIFQQVEQNVRLVVNVEKEVRNLTLNLEAILAVLADAERRQVKEDSVRRWLNNLKEVSCEIDDVVDEWSTDAEKESKAIEARLVFCSCSKSEFTLNGAEFLKARV